MDATYLFYDIETTGLNKCFDQVLQFAAIRTDLNINEIERYEITIKLNPDVIPSPGAVITHRIGVNQTQNGLNEIEAMHKIHQLLNTPGTISLGYNTLGFDDEFLRFSFYRNLLAPYTHQYANQCGRMDIYPMTVMYYLFKPDVLNWPETNTKVSLKLENLNAANNLASGPAHNAIVDVEVTVALAKRLLQHQDMWCYVKDYFNKQADLNRINQLSSDEALLVNGKIGSDNNYLAPVLCLGQHQHYKNQTLWLRLDSEELAKANVKNIAETTFVFRKKPAENLLLLPAHDRFLKKISANRLQLAESNKKYLKKQTELLQKICNYHQHYKYPEVRNLDIDAALYEIGFPSPREEFLFNQFHQAEPNDKSSIAERFPNPKRREQAIRILGRHYPNYLSANDQTIFEQYMDHIKSEDPNKIMRDYRNEIRLTPKTALGQISKFNNNLELDEQQLALLSDLETYIKQYDQ